ncbi:family 43 glycosylhydrolase [Cellulomonas xiejunii]|uniref:Family 43 glycosylhydrolase n=1 Tax=Cellulomonas xiejunii TaxID=2968083 RepID=A0ABY5KPZ7_9CELL|nr:family 43 glycosylhydrolase [Cellulomonas xiejunii]MCC2322422.1 family 43 glycosylhydrolase [Cellulomonas xiejunii]UUI72470.1 family 43 glycosylhydrolase [Cellulomonas xiejunii]
MSGAGTGVEDVTRTTTAADAVAPEVALIDGPLVDGVFTADPSGHVWDGVLYVYASHDEDTGASDSDEGGHYDMRDYRVIELRDLAGPAIEHAQVLHVDDVPWAARQMWAPDAARRGDTYYLFFPARDHEGVFRIGVATSSSPTGPFVAECQPIAGIGSIDPAVLVDDDESAYLYVGGLQGGQLQRWDGDTYTGVDTYPADDAPALGPRVARLTDDLLALAEPTREVLVTDETGTPLTQGDPRRFFEGPWVSRVDGVYHLLYSTGSTHTLVHATSDSPYGPFTYRGTVLEPVAGWTTHGSIAQVGDRWYLLYHDAQVSGRDHLRNVRIAPLTVHADGRLTAEVR